MLILWLKAFHVFAVIAWFAGLFYLPRLLVYHAEASEPVVRERLKVMERRLLMMTNIGGALTILLGLATLGAWQYSVPDYFRQAHWLHVKLALVLLLIVYHGVLTRLVRSFARDTAHWTPRSLRLFNELPALLLIGIVVLAVVKPF
ncbi:MAG TPA: CopD family protein [Rhodanobacteraceae bacterium]|nr:CopD family protein [Rhodanobacteraceae bacterium]